MAAGVFGANIELDVSDGAVTINSILGGANSYEKLIITVAQLGPNPGVIHIGGSVVSSSIFGHIMRTGETSEFVANTSANMGSTMKIFNPSSDTLRVDILGFATA